MAKAHPQVCLVCFNSLKDFSLLMINIVVEKRQFVFF